MANYIRPLILFLIEPIQHCLSSKNFVFDYNTIEYVEAFTLYSLTSVEGEIINNNYSYKTCRGHPLPVLPSNN
ncbi:hypothetical protein BpHYR1_032417 [Brachionus plicatilis]|uniref:Uncharacterized protein n=1 Tax=Brachionus plicatilis TaxID=10195 RepID=A0A3M7T2L5_BRAPC|nr:hypothetical protein BpHYR1_032417 [Brachionus plicatilis]